MNTNPSSGTRALVLVLFFVSGACTLVYEVVWVRMLVLVFGTSVFAVSTVLSAFMAGLALGSAIFGRWADRWGRGLRTYAWLETGIGLFALVFPFLLNGLDEVYTALYRALGGTGLAFSLLRFLLAFLVLLLPATLMGATLPVLTKFFVRRSGRLGGGVGALYALNTLGATAGCLLAAFFLMEWVGIAGATWIAAGGNLTIAAVSFLLSRGAAGSRSNRGRPTRERASIEPIESGAGRPPFLAGRLVFWGFALSGFAALGYEVVWTRLLSVVLRLTTAQSLSVILVAFLFGLAAGSAVGARFVDRWPAPFLGFALIELALGLFGLVSVASLGHIPQMQAALFSIPSWWGYLLKLLVIAWGIMLVPTFLMGLLFPMAGKIHARDLTSLGRRIGNIYAVNTTGAIFGAFAAGFVLIPSMGTQGSILALAWINLAVGFAVLALGPTCRVAAKLGLLGAFAVPALLFTFLLPPGYLRDLLARSQPDGELLYCDEGIGGTVTVYEFAGGRRVLRVNGAGEVPTDRASIETFRLLGNLPMMLHPDPEKVLVIAFGGGITLSAVESHAPRRIDCVEVSPGVIDAARYFAPHNNRIFERLDESRFELIIDDGRNHVLRTQRRYDVIISDSTHPGSADSWVLYTEEFYRLCRKRLKAGGLFAQWLPLHGLTEEGYKIVLRTFHRAFPHATLWVTEGYSVLLGTPDTLRIDFGRVARRLGRDAVRVPLGEVDLGDPVSFLAAFALNEETLVAYTGPGPINTDDRPHISFASRMRSGAAGEIPVMSSLIPYLSEGIDAELRGANDRVRADLSRRLRARKQSFLGEIAWRMRLPEQASQHVRRALDLDPTEPGARRLQRRLRQPER